MCSHKVTWWRYDPDAKEVDGVVWMQNKDHPDLWRERIKGQFCRYRVNGVVYETQPEANKALGELYGVSVRPVLRLLVTGGRDYGDKEALFSALDRVHDLRNVRTVIAGAATGADQLAAAWAKDRGIELIEFPADWKAHGKAAGPLRNQQMIDEAKPTGVAAFPGGSGTADMVKRAEAAGLKVWFPAQVVEKADA